MSTPAATYSARTAARTAAPLISLGVTWVVRKGMMKGYESRTGRPAPVVHSRDASLMSKVVWAATMAAVLALIETVVWEMLSDDE